MDCRYRVSLYAKAWRRIVLDKFSDEKVYQQYYL
jgi:hypothetical protein